MCNEELISKQPSSDLILKTNNLTLLRKSVIEVTMLQNSHRDDHMVGVVMEMVLFTVFCSEQFRDFGN